MAFQQHTRRKLVALSAQAKAAGSNPLIWELPKVGLLGGLFITITGAVAGTLSNQNTFGFSSIIRRVRLIANAGIDLWNVSGPSYFWMVKDFVEDYKDPVPSTSGRTAITATTFVLDMYLPVAYNSRDPLGLIMLQNEQTQLTLTVEFEADATVATGATVTATVTPYVELFTVPVDPKEWPSLTTMHQVVEDSRVISGAGEYQYVWPRGNTYIQVLHGAGFAVSGTGADAFSSYKLQMNQSEVIEGPLTPGAASMEYARSHGRARTLGVMPWDLAGSSGLGVFGSIRDIIYSQLVTDIESVITFTGATTLYTVRRQLVALTG